MIDYRMYYLFCSISNVIFSLVFPQKAPSDKESCHWVLLKIVQNNHIQENKM